MSGEVEMPQSPAEEKADQLSAAISDAALSVIPHTKARDAAPDDRRLFETGLVETLWTTIDHCKNWKLARVGMGEGHIAIFNTVGDMTQVPTNIVPKALRISLRWAVNDSVEMLARGFETYEELQLYRQNKGRKKVTNATSGAVRRTAGNAVPHIIQPDRRLSDR